MWLGMAVPTVSWAQPSAEQTALEDSSAPVPTLVNPVSPKYPDGLPPGLEGVVDVCVEVDAQGAITDIRLVAGPPEFQVSALEAAARLHFTPAEVDGEPVAGVAQVSFRFHAPVHWHAEGDVGDEIVVRGEDPDLHDTHARTTLRTAELEATAGDGLAQSAAQVAGVTVAATTGSNAKPIIRGHTERRLLLIHDGMRHESQKWGPDHAPEIDPFTAGTVSIIRGAAGARYGPDAIGGVVIVDPPEMREDAGVGGTALVMGATNGWRRLGAARLDVVPTEHDAWTVRLEGSHLRSASRSTPDYVLGNTAVHEWGLGAAVEHRSERRTVRARFHHYDRAEGIFYGVRLAVPSEFEAQYNAGVPVGADQWTTDTELDRPRQAVTHDLALLRSDGETPSGWTLSGVYAFQRNHRLEFDQVRSASVTGPQFDFTLRTHSLDLSLSPPVRQLGTSTLESGAGVQGTFQENVYRGYPLLPNYRSFGGGVFAHARLSSALGAVAAAGRVDHLGRVAYIRDDDFARIDGLAGLESQDCEAYSAGQACGARYTAGSVSVGGIWHAVPDTVDVKLDLSSASRFPAVDELYLVGSSPSLPVYAVSDPALGVETTWGASPTLGLRSLWAEGEVSGYVNYVDDYIYFAPALDGAGEVAYRVTIEGTWPEYTSAPRDVVFAGADGVLDLLPAELVGVRSQGSVVRARDLASGDHLVGIPPDRGYVEAVVRPRPPGRVERWDARVRVTRVGRQSRVRADQDVLPAPEGATLLGASATAEVAGRDRTWRLGVQATNLTQVRYREYTSLLRYYADQPGRDVRVRVAVDL